MSALILQLFDVFSPIIVSMVQRHYDKTGSIPTSEQLRAELESNVDAILAEGAEWRARKNPPTPPAG